MLDKLRHLLRYEFTIAELIGLAMMLATPYLVIGVIWSSTHTEHLQNMHGLDRAVSFLGSMVSWPVLLFSNMCMT